MLAQIHQSVHNSSLENIGTSIQDSLRKIGFIHKFKERTVDVPFDLKITKDGKKLVAVIRKASVPRKFDQRKLWGAQRYLEHSVGLSMEIRETKDSIALCYDLPLAV